MEAIDAIRTRRSVRRYTDQPVPDILVADLLRAASAAPSAGNQQPWEFVVVRDRAVLEVVASANPYGGMAREAQLAIVVCGNLEREHRPGFWVQDCAAATQNLLLAAHAAGVGAVWCGTYPREERMQPIAAVLGLPEHVLPFSVIPLGYPAEQPAPADRYDQRRVHVDRW
jgi:nitroreductase